MVFKRPVSDNLLMSGDLCITGDLCRISSVSQGSFAKETYDFKEPTNRSHPIWSSKDQSVTIF